VFLSTHADVDTPGAKVLDISQFSARVSMDETVMV